MEDHWSFEHNWNNNFIIQNLSPRITDRRTQEKSQCRSTSQIRPLHYCSLMITSRWQLTDFSHNWMKMRTTDRSYISHNWMRMRTTDRSYNNWSILVTTEWKYTKLIDFYHNWMKIRTTGKYSSRKIALRSVSNVVLLPCRTLNEALENEDRSTKHPNLENEAPKTRKRSTQNLKTKHTISKTKHPRSKLPRATAV